MCSTAQWTILNITTDIKIVTHRKRIIEKEIGNIAYHLEGSKLDTLMGPWIPPWSRLF